MNIIVFKTKYDDRAFIADDDVQISRACYTMLVDNLSAGWYYEPTKPQDRVAKVREGLTDEQIDNLPEPIKTTLKSEIARAERLSRTEKYDYDMEMWFWNGVNRIAKMGIDLGALVVDAHTGRFLATELADRRSDYEYEGYEFSEVETP